MDRDVFMEYAENVEASKLSDSEKRDAVTREYIRNLETLLIERDHLLSAIPPCPVHGSQCVPHALEWIEKQKAKEPYCATHGHQWLKLAGYSYCISCGERKENDNGE